MIIDEIFNTIATNIGDKLWQGYCSFVERCSRQKECGLENEILDFVIRDVSWACIENVVNEKGFFTELMEVYKEGYFPCSWDGEYPEGKFVVM